MGEGMTWNDIKALEALLTPVGSSEEDRSLHPKHKAVATPATVGGLRASKKKEEHDTLEKADPDFEFGDKYGRMQPEYDIIYKQDVSANDVYLQMCTGG